MLVMYMRGIIGLKELKQLKTMIIDIRLVLLTAETVVPTMIGPIHEMINITHNTITTITMEEALNDGSSQGILLALDSIMKEVVPTTTEGIPEIISIIRDTMMITTNIMKHLGVKTAHSLVW